MVMLKYRLKYRMFILVYLLCACGCAVVPSPPTPKPSKPLPAPPSSTVEATTTVKFSAIEQILERHVPRVLYQADGEKVPGCPLDSCKYRIKVVRGDIQLFRTKAGALGIRLPIRTEKGRVDVKQNILIKTIRTHLEVNAAVSARISSSLKLQPDWSVKSDVQFDYSIKNADACANIAGSKLCVSLESVLNKELDKLVPGITHRIQKILEEQSTFKPYVTRMWHQLHGVFVLQKSPRIYLKVDPTAVLAQQPKILAKEIRLGAALISTMEVINTKDAVTSPKAEPLPTLKINGNINGRFSLQVPVRISLKSLNARLDQMIGTDIKFKVRGKNVTATLQKAKASINGPDISIRAEFKASRKSGAVPKQVTGYFYGTPQFDTTDGTLRFDPFDFDARTEKRWANAVAWLHHDKLKKAIQKKLVFDLSAEVEKIKKTLSQNSAAIDLGHGFVLKATVRHLDVPTVSTSNDFVSAYITTTGKIQIYLTK